MTKLFLLLRMAIIAGLLALGALVSAPVAAQDATEAADEVTAQAEDVVEEDDEGFEWGLLGLLGLAGLAGLMRRPKPVVHENLGQTGTRTVNRVDDRNSDSRSL